MAENGEGFIKILEDPKSFFNDSVEFKKLPDDETRHFPRGMLNGVAFSFVHYKTFQEAVDKWKIRSERMIWDNIYVIATGHDGLESAMLMEKFDKLPYRHKIMFTFNKWDYPWAFQVKKTHGIIRPFTEIATFSGKRFYETAFDIPSWIRSCEMRK